jgi:4-hydroxy-tetrahydrodipicolinate synthase
MSTDLRGIYAAVVTPFDEDGQPALDQLAAHLAHLARRGCHGVLLCGTTGEGPSLSVEERVAVFEAAAGAGTGLRLLGGTGGVSLEDVVTLTRAAFDGGLDGVVILPPFFYLDPTPDGLFDFFAGVVKRAVPEDGAVLLYHNPFIAGPGIDAGLIRRLRDAFPAQVVGVKNSSRDWDYAHMLLDTFPGFQVLVGADALLARSLEAGGAGAITGLANLFPDLLRDVYDLYRQGASPAEAQKRLDAAAAQLDGLPRIPATKALLAAGGIIEAGDVRPPLRGLAEAEFDELARRFHLGVEMPGHIDLDAPQGKT